MKLTYSNRPDYQVLMANQKLQELNLKNKYAEALPTIGAFANLGYEHAISRFWRHYFRHKVIFLKRKV